MISDIFDYNWFDLIQTNSLQTSSIIENKIVIPNLSARSSLIYDIKNKKTKYSNNINEELPIASLTKLMTAYIILEEHNLNEIFTVSEEATSIDGSKMYLQTNEKITIRELLHGLLISSGNDAAYTLAIGNSGSTRKFVKKMNKKAKELGMQNSNFTNPAGLDIGKNTSSAKDLLILTKEIIKHQIILDISQKQKYNAKNLSKNITHKLENTNKELDNFLNIKGLKTGRTPLAKECFIGLTNEENPKISIVLGSNNRFQDTKTLLYLYN